MSVACRYGDMTCPCQDGLLCHYEGPNPMLPPAADWVAYLEGDEETCGRGPTETEALRALCELLAGDSVRSERLADPRR